MDEKEFDQLNVIPLVDVMLVVLTIVLTTSTFIAKGTIPVELPRASHSREEISKTITLELDKGGSVYYEGLRVSQAVLAEKLAPLPRATAVLIRSDRDIRLQGFIEVLDLLKGMGFGKVSVQTERGAR